MDVLVATDLTPPSNTGSLDGLVVLDLTRILAGPTCTQLLGDLGAEVIKIERPVKGDDTRAWGPPFLQDEHGNDMQESAYYLCANRNKSSVAVDIATKEGVQIIKNLAKNADILVENFKVGDLEKRGLSYQDLKQVNPKLVYCSITGFGQTGPYAKRAGYDFLAQGMGGIMALTGFPEEEGGQPTKIGVGVTDVMCGMYAATAILAAIHSRQSTGNGQHIDISLLDSQVAWLINQGTSYLTSGDVPGRIGNSHPTIVPYQTFNASDKPFIIAVGNDGQFERLCQIAGAPELASDARFKHNFDRVRNRKELIPLLKELTPQMTSEEWISKLEDVGVPCGPVNTMDEVFENPQIQHRGMKLEMEYPSAKEGHVNLISNPIKLSGTPVQYRKAPPKLGADTLETLLQHTKLNPEEIENLAKQGILDLGGD
ncbi:CaiB/BaiF CoA transferase family protein [Flexibacterium corallicola]|uniref:CaiB/BaiF CoA transferase family protein n=1 Tax=Flexibacterium corallicola TaxID=3037259 RepID=UPI00286F91A3|nr:CaiB/BaiF CoA-transferase family protein [Pseudovibrio sp. M1P-2-3]